MPDHVPVVVLGRINQGKEGDLFRENVTVISARLREHFARVIEVGGSFLIIAHSRSFITGRVARSLVTAVPRTGKNYVCPLSLCPQNTSARQIELTILPIILSSTTHLAYFQGPGYSASTTVILYHIVFYCTT